MLAITVLEHGFLVLQFDLAHVGIQRLVAKSAETYNDNARQPQGRRNRRRHDPREPM
jgi:hypothetical protein